MQTARHQIFVAVLAIALFFTNLGKPKLWDRDEPRNARCAAEMLERGDWIVPTFNGELRTHKPVLLYWLMMSAYSAFGVNEFAARFWSAGLAVGTVLLTYSMGRRLLSPRAGLWAATILSTTLMFNVAARAATPDSALMFFMTLALAIYVQTSFRAPKGPAYWLRCETLARDSQGGGEADSIDNQTFYPRWPFLIPLYAAMGIAVLAKGPVGIVLPTAIIGLFLAIIRQSKGVVDSATCKSSFLISVGRFLRPLSPWHLSRTAWSMRPITALLSALAIALPWYLLVAMETDGRWVQSFLMEHNIGRASTAMEGHAGSTLFYYPIAILVGFFPWSIFAVPVCLDVWHVLKSKDSWANGYMFLLCWAGVFIGIFSLAQTKLPSYVTPAYPAIALLTAGCIERLATRASHVKAHWLQAAAVSLAAIGFLGAIAAIYSTKKFLPGAEHLAFICLIPFASGVAAMSFANRRMIHQFSVSVSIGAAALMLAVFGYASPQISEGQRIADLLQSTRTVGAPTPLASFAVHEPSWVFYAEREVPFLTEDQDALEFLERTDAALLTTNAEFARIRAHLPVGARVIAEAPYFLKGERLVLIGRPAHVAKARVPAPR